MLYLLDVSLLLHAVLFIHFHCCILFLAVICNYFPYDSWFKIWVSCNWGFINNGRAILLNVLMHGRSKCKLWAIWWLNVAMLHKEIFFSYRIYCFSAIFAFPNSHICQIFPFLHSSFGIIFCLFSFETLLSDLQTNSSVPHC